MLSDGQQGESASLEPGPVAWLQTFVEASNDVVFVLDHQAQVRYVNPEAERLIGASSDELLGRDLFSASPPGIADPLASAIRSCLAGNCSGRLTFCDAASLTWFDAVLVPLPGGLGVRASDMTTWHDDTAQLHQRNHDLSRAQEDAMAAAQAKASWLGRMNHELLAPLNSVLGFAELLADDPDGRMSAEQADYTRQIYRAGQTLLRLTQDSLELALSERGEVHLREETVELGAIIDETRSLLGPCADRMHVTITVDCDENARLVRGDSTRLRQIVTNLVANAMKYSKPEGGRVDVAVLAPESSGILIRIADDGVGIAESQQQAIFEPFQRGEQGDAGKEGHGIGLAVTRRLVDLMDGRIEVKSTPGNGAVFSVFLPLPRVEPGNMGNEQA